MTNRPTLEDAATRVKRYGLRDTDISRAALAEVFRLAAQVQLNDRLTEAVDTLAAWVRQP